MDFFDREARAQKQTRRLVWLFGLTILAVLVVNNVLLCPLVYCCTHSLVHHESAANPLMFLATAFNLFGEALVDPPHFCALVFHSQPILWVSLGTLVSIFAGSYYKMTSTVRRRPVVAQFARRTPRRRQAGRSGRTASAQRRRGNGHRLRHAGAGNFVLDCERGINAFAAGHTRDDVALGVTRGCVKLLTRDELQGIVAHEFSHILNGDTRLNMRLIGLAHGLFWPTLLGRRLLYCTREQAPELCGRKTSRARPRFCRPRRSDFIVCRAWLVQPAVRAAHQKRHLPPARMARGRRRRAIHAQPAGHRRRAHENRRPVKHGRLDTPHAEVASHLYFANCNYEPWLGFLSTHPPLAKRISAIYPLLRRQFPRR